MGYILHDDDTLIGDTVDPIYDKCIDNMRKEYEGK